MRTELVFAGTCMDRHVIVMDSSSSQMFVAVSVNLIGIIVSIVGIVLYAIELGAVSVVWMCHSYRGVHNNCLEVASVAQVSVLTRPSQTTTDFCWKHLRCDCWIQLQFRYTPVSGANIISPKLDINNDVLSGCSFWLIWWPKTGPTAEKSTHRELQMVDLAAVWNINVTLRTAE